jgi:uncharacterized membrane protein YebE (DUF533 family)
MNKKRETMTAVEEKSSLSAAKEKVARGVYALGYTAATFACSAPLLGITAFASEEDAKKALKNTLTKVGSIAGIGLIAYGVYEVIMSVLQQAPEQKTKGLIMAAVGAALTGIGTLLNFL